MLINFYWYLRNVNTFLRTNRIAHFTTDTVFAYIIAGNRRFPKSDHKAISDNMRWIVDVKVFTLCFIDTEYFQCGLSIAGINFLHVGVLFKNCIQLGRMNVFNLFINGYRYTIRNKDKLFFVPLWLE